MQTDTEPRAEADVFERYLRRPSRRRLGRVVDAETSESISVFNVKLVGGGGYGVHRREPGGLVGWGAG